MGYQFTCGFKVMFVTKNFFLVKICLWIVFWFCIMKNFVPFYYFLHLVLFLFVNLLIELFLFVLFMNGSFFLSCGSTTGHSILYSFIRCCCNIVIILFKISIVVLCSSGEEKMGLELGWLRLYTLGFTVRPFHLGLCDGVWDFK